MAAKLFDPFYLSKLNYNQVVLKIDNLKSFEYKEFTAEFLANMKKEVPIVMEHVKQEFDWVSIEVSVGKLIVKTNNGECITSLI